MGKLKILWGVDPFQDERPLRTRCETLLRGLGKKAGTVEPVYVSNPFELQDRYRKVAEERLTSFLSKVKGLTMRPARVIEEAAPGLAAAAWALAEYAAKAKADALVLGTNARSGLSRFVLGSYAETLLAFAKIPLIFVNPSSRVTGKIRKILFATDLSPASRKAFSSLCRFAKAVDASVEVLHAVETPRHWATTYGYLLVGNRAMTVDDYSASLKRTGLRKIEIFLKIAKSAGVKATPRIEIASQRVAGIALKTAGSSGADLIALAAQSSRLRAGLLGSVAREVLRESRLPIWILHVVR